MGFAKRRCLFSLRHDQKQKVARSEAKYKLVKFSAFFEQTLSEFERSRFDFEISHTQQPAKSAANSL